VLTKAPLRPPSIRRRAARVCAVVFTATLAACADGAEPAGPAPPASALRYTDIDAGYFHTCALTVTGSAYCWGGNAFGTLGDGTRTDRSRPTRVIGTPILTTLDAGAGHSCALDAAGAAWCWGQNDEGQLGDGTFTARTAPVAVSGGRAFAAISAGHAHSCGLTAAGEAWCWGDDSRGQLGDGGTVGPGKSAVPVRVAAAGPLSVVVAGYYATCALSSDGAAWCWGMNGDGQVGDDAVEDRATPVAVGRGLPFTSISVGDRFVCAISSGSTWCWGANRAGETGTDMQGALLPRQLATPPASAVFTSAGASTVPETDENNNIGVSFDAQIFN
jgi:alpha-tubulin suppressor-like RCC1 family protein